MAGDGKMRKNRRSRGTLRRQMTGLGQKRPKLPWLPAGKNTHEHMGWIVLRRHCIV